MATINFPDTSVNNPDTSAPWADGDTTTINADGVDITYIFKKPSSPNTGSWWKSAGRNNPATPIDKIEEGNTSAEVIDTGTNGQFVVSTEGAARMKVTSDGTVKLNGSNIDTDPSIQLNPNGSARFASAITNETGWSNTDTPQFLLDSYTVSADLQLKSISTHTGHAIRILAGGTAAGNERVELNYDGSSTFAADATINGLTVGRGAGDDDRNTAVGNDALNANTTGINNTAIGKQALQSNEGGSTNTALGRRSLHTNTSGDDNTAIGVSALFANTTGKNNTCVGSGALVANTEGDNNTALGLSALNANITGEYNTAIGYNAGRFIGGSNNTILGPYLGTSTDASLSDTVIISAGTTERLRIDSTGKIILPGTGSVPGIQFGSADTNASPGGNISSIISQTLDDYEEGTFSPQYNWTGVTGGDANNVGIGRYTKIGDTVYYRIRFDVKGAGANFANALTVTALPFTSNSDSIGSNCSIASQILADDITCVTGFIQENQSAITFRVKATSANWTTLTPANLGLDGVTARWFQVTGFYRA